MGHGFYSEEGVSSVIHFDQVLCVDVVRRFPGVVALKVIIPFNKILQRLCMAIVLVFEDSFPSINLGRGWEKVGS